MGIDTRDKILQAAFRLIVRQGYTATSVHQISKEAGIGKATVYHHFPDKQAIAFSLLDRSSSRVRDALAAVGAEAGLRLRSESFDLFQVIRRELPDSRARIH